MDKTTIIALFGPAGSGKDYVQQFMVEHYKINNIISCTTRPPREGEEDGVAYHFLKPDEFKYKVDNNQMLEHTIFREWGYGTSLDSLRKGLNVGVFNIQGVQSLLNFQDMEIIPVKVFARDKTRLLRQLNREGSPDCEEIIRRFQTDKEDFQSIPFDYQILDNDTDFFYTHMQLDRLVNNI